MSYLQDKNKTLWKMAVMVCVCLVGIAGTASADEENHHKVALELIDVMNMQDTTDEMLLLIENMIKEQFESMLKDLPPEGQIASDAVQEETMEWFREFFAWERLRGLYADIYIEVFTEVEMRELIEFYRSPLGQKLLAKSPELMQKSIEKTQALLYQEMPKLQERLERKIKELETQYN